MSSADLNERLNEVQIHTLGTSSDNGRNRVPLEGPPTCGQGVSYCLSIHNDSVTHQDHSLGGSLSIVIITHWYIKHDGMQGDVKT